MRTKFFLLLGAILLWGCSDTLEESPSSDFQKLEIQINGNIDQEYVSRVNDGGFCDGDQIGLYGVNWTDKNNTQGTLQDKNNQVDNVRYTYDGEKGVWSSSVSAYYKDMNTNIDLYAYYPYGAPTNVTKYPFEVAKDQNNDDGYGISDFLWAKTENVEPTEGKVKLIFDHILSCVKVVLTEGENFEKGEFEKLSKSVMVKNTKHTSEINLSTGIATVTGDPSNEGILMMEDESDSFRAIVVPQTVGAQNVLFAITVDGITYNYKQAAAFVYEAGKQATFTLSVTKNTTTGTYEFELTDTQIVDWTADIKSHGGTARQYYVVNMETPGTLGELIAADGKNPNKIANLKIIGNVDARDFYFMRDNMAILEAVNMKECKIQACEIGEHEWNLTQYQADEIPSNAFYNKSSLVYYVFPEKVVKIGYQAYYNTHLSGALIIPNDVIEIESDAFRGINITSLSLSEKIQKIGSGAFSQCNVLSGDLNLPNALQNIGENCFYGCGLNGTLKLSSSLKEIPRSCFERCNFVGDLIIPDNIKVIGDAAFYLSDNFTGQILLPAGLESIGMHAFDRCGFQGELVIPEKIKVIEEGTFAECNFSNIIFPEGLLIVGERAFASNPRLCEPLIFPNSLLTIDTQAFAFCPQITAVHFSPNLATIQDKAFHQCYGIYSMISHATLPPTIIGSAFNGVAKDNFTLEVPEASVADYQTANGWNEFRRISPHHDFSISRPSMRMLNDKLSRTYILRAPNGLKWSIEEKPDWVTVTPSSGTGKTEVTVTVNEMAPTDDTFESEYIDKNGYIKYHTYEGRSGKIVFLLNDKNYRSTMTIEQYDYEYGDGDVIYNPNEINENGVNLVFMGDCFDARDIATGKYIEGINQAIEHFFAIEPYKTYRNYFNVYTIVGMSPDSGMGTVNTIRDAKFGSQYTIHGGVSPNESITFEYACFAPTVNEMNINQSLVVMIENSQDYGGVTYMWPDGSAIAVCPMSDDAYPYDFRGLVQHEAGGHGFGKLGDEYIYHNEFIEACECICCSHVKELNKAKSLGWFDNLSLNGDMNYVPWTHLIFHPKYSNVVDMYEGGFFHTRGVYRSEATSCMNNNIPYFSAISRQSIVERIMEYSGETFSLEDFYAKDVMDAGGRSARQPWDKWVTPNYVGASKQHAPKIMSGKPRIGK